MTLRWKIVAGAVGAVMIFGTAEKCGGDSPESAQVQKRAVAANQAGLQNLLDKQPPFFPSHSDERDNINERTARYQDPNKVSYITVLTIQGGILYHGVVKGKVSSVDSQVTPADGLDCQHFGDRRPDGCGTVQIAEPDGSWGTNNPNAMFWFDDKNVYHETSLPYFVSDQEQTLSTPPVLNINATQQTNALPQTGKAG